MADMVRGTWPALIAKIRTAPDLRKTLGLADVDDWSRPSFMK
jgi:hypothetical protein